jgi:hypothetical protein
LGPAGLAAQRFRRAEVAVTGVNRFSVPWNAIMGTALWSWHAIHGRNRADATNPTAAMRSGIVQERTSPAGAQVPRRFSNPGRASGFPETQFEARVR